MEDSGPAAVTTGGDEQETPPAERFSLPQVEAAEGKFQPVLLYFFLQEDEDDAATRLEACRKLEERLFVNRADVALAAEPFLRLEVNARKVPIAFLKIWKVSRAPTLYVLSHTGQIRYRFTDPSTTPRQLANALSKVAVAAEAEKKKAEAGSK
ncbi:MAG: hypothetical protein HY720_04765 [Planctomycetes bacterium]|nr:hypothetical protein [Planctomycetota bacterium]